MSNYTQIEGETRTILAKRDNHQYRSAQTFTLQMLNSSHDTGASVTTWRRINIISAVYIVPTTVAIIISLALDFQKPCIKPPLRTWITLQGLIQVLMLISNISFCVRSSSNNRERRAHSVNQFYFLSRFLNFFWLIWFTVGVAWVFQPAIDPDSCIKTAPNIYRLSLALIIMEISIIGLTFIMCCCAVPVLWILYLCGYGNQTHSELATRKLLRTRTTTKNYVQGQISPEDASCVICLIEYQPGDELRYLPCHHHFHKQCIDEWLKKYSKLCPLCKTDIDTNEKETPSAV